ncbi:roadblock/LC7 domain-containing protein, partial [Streptomyces daliensis]|nr:roadblock/LC7 domain-containing protein [Streptomyces daliensis]
MTPDNGPSWLLENLVRETPGAQSALLCSRDGLRLERYELTVTQADTLSSLLSGLYSLGRGTGKVLVDDPFGTVHQILVEHPLGLLAVMDAG